MDFADSINIVGNVVSVNDISSCFLLFLIPSFPIVIPLVYTEGIVPSMFTDGYSERIFC